MNQKYYIETYGCQMNVYDSELVASLLQKSGYVETDQIHDADAIFLNTCSIREKAEETVQNRLSNFHHLKRKNPKVIIGVLGCMAQNLKDDLLESKPFVDVILGPDSYRKLPEFIHNRKTQMDHLADTRLSKFEVYEDMFPTRKEGVNAWISIMRGCDKFCTFCIVPFTRGRERSRTIESIVHETEQAVREGFIEITLLGQNVNSFRNPDGGDFPDLLEAVAAVPGVQRIRYTSPHPCDIDDKLLNVMLNHDNICNHIHLPLQAGSDRILKRMNRTYTQKEFLNLVDKIRMILPDCSITTDIIVGFPGETEDEFKETLKVVWSVRFDSAFMFKYSPRPGTKAVEFNDHVPEEEKQQRLERLIALQKSMTLIAIQKQIGKSMKVIVEKESKKSRDQWSGRTDGNTWVIFNKSGEKIKDIVDIKITDARGVSLFGERIQMEVTV
ncbi:MAG: tRNA (N6-isopentenyl adenosine(37)-C2)-methylthiotransferase MiaB [Candidatus Marinimicrobia bacterium]|nr:tRNA (N6-isopentenyl adenosine(37)-C2)-methylthiotransferase MiaB [Candidatus Neomarinimicrobiota bacterium]